MQVYFTKLDTDVWYNLSKVPPVLTSYRYSIIKYQLSYNISYGQGGGEYWEGKKQKLKGKYFKHNQLVPLSAYHLNITYRLSQIVFIWNSFCDNFSWCLCSSILWQMLFELIAFCPDLILSFIFAQIPFFKWLFTICVITFWYKLLSCANYFLCTNLFGQICFCLDHFQ